MSKQKLPPLLSNIHQSLLRSSDPALVPLRHELETLNRLVEHAEKADPTELAIKELKELRQGFTELGGKYCKCCGRPF